MCGHALKFVNSLTENTSVLSGNMRMYSIVPEGSVLQTNLQNYQIDSVSGSFFTNSGICTSGIVEPNKTRMMQRWKSLAFRSSVRIRMTVRDLRRLLSGMFDGLGDLWRGN